MIRIVKEMPWKCGKGWWPQAKARAKSAMPGFAGRVCSPMASLAHSVRSSSIVNVFCARMDSDRNSTRIVRINRFMDAFENIDFSIITEISIIQKMLTLSK